MPDFPRLITVAVAGTDGRMSVSGTSLGSQHKQRLVRVFGEDVDVEPAPHMAFLRYVDAPGIGGKVGTLLGEWGVNIGHMSVGRGKLGDEAVMALTLDESLTAEQTARLVARLRPDLRAHGRSSLYRGPVRAAEVRRGGRAREGVTAQRRPAPRAFTPAASRGLAHDLRQLVRDGEGVALAVLEPAGLEAALGAGDAVHRLEPGEVVLLEADALACRSRTVPSTSSVRKLQYVVSPRR